MKHITYLTIFFSFTIITSCDPSHDLKLDNQTGKTIEVLYSPSSDLNYFGENRTEMIEINGRSMNKILLDSSETLRIGNVNARYIPNADDIYMDYLEIRNGTDTIKLTGRHSILSTVQQVKKLDWRLIIK